MMPAEKIFISVKVEWIEYKLVIEPPSELLKKMNNSIGQIFNSTLPEGIEITIATLYAREEMEATLFRWLQRICNLQQAFTISIKNFGCRPPQSVFLKIEDVSPINRIINQIKMIEPYLQGSGCPPSEINQSPELRVFNFPENIFPEAREVFNSISFEDSFTSPSLKMYKRKGDQNKFDLLSCFSLPH